MNDMGIIGLWIKDIVVLFTLISIVELVMPKGNMKKYIELVIGILVMFTIISPFAKLMNYDFKLDNSLYNYTRDQEEKIAGKEDLYMSHEEGVKSLVIEKMKGEISHIVKNKGEYNLIDIQIDLEIYDDSEKINSIYIILGTDRPVEKDITIEKIPPIKIDEGREEEKLETDKAISEQFEGIRGEIADKFSINSEIVKVDFKE